MARTETGTVVVVSDAGPLIHLDELGCLEFLANYQRVLVPSEVWREVEKHRPRALLNKRVVLLKTFLQGAPTPTIRSVASLLELHRGETEALQVALEQGAGLLLTDDAAARLAAGNLNIAVTGTVGILMRSIRTGMASPEAIIAVLSTLSQKSTLHIKPSLLQELIQMIETWKARPPQA
ncbi:MAG: hypothetical protein K1X53_09840 [Candidatus Sumerlaeaceae bacterium]|nr:hypothetical protein [Candidatus Sumerlaeaceae bacterium]